MKEKEDVSKLTKEQIAEYFCKRCGHKPESEKWRRDYEKFMGWTVEVLREQYCYVRGIHTDV